MFAVVASNAEATTQTNGLLVLIRWEERERQSLKSGLERNASFQRF